MKTTSTYNIPTNGDIMEMSTDALYHESRRLLEVTVGSKSHPQYGEYLDVHRRYLDVLRTIPQAPKDLQMKAIMAFNSDKRFSITE